MSNTLVPSRVCASHKRLRCEVGGWCACRSDQPTRSEVELELFLDGLSSRIGLISRVCQSRRDMFRGGEDPENRSCRQNVRLAFSAVYPRRRMSERCRGIDVREIPCTGVDVCMYPARLLKRGGQFVFDGDPGWAPPAPRKGRVDRMRRGLSQLNKGETLRGSLLSGSVLARR